MAVPTAPAASAPPIDLPVDAPARPAEGSPADALHSAAPPLPGALSVAEPAGAPLARVAASTPVKPLSVNSSSATVPTAEATPRPAPETAMVDALVGVPTAAAPASLAKLDRDLLDVLAGSLSLPLGK